MTGFFVPGVAPGAETERAYEELRSAITARTGKAPRGRRIFALNCRRGGSDSEARVGELDPCTGETVRAIFAVEDGYAITWTGGYADVTRRQTYEAIEFA